MYAVFVDDGFDSMFKDKEEAKEHASEMRKTYCMRAYVHRLTRSEMEFFGITSKR